MHPDDAGEICHVRYRIFGLVAALVLAPAARGLAAQATFDLDFDGSQEAGTVGDPDGDAKGTITLNDVTGNISWNITYSNIEPTLSGFHIHGPAAPPGVSTGIFIGLGTGTTGGANTLINSIAAAPASVAQVLANPGQFYVNIHTTPTYAAGAIRDQLGTLVPEPSTLVLVSLALVGLRRRRA